MTTYRSLLTAASFVALGLAMPVRGLAQTVDIAPSIPITSALPIPVQALPAQTPAPLVATPVESPDWDAIGAKIEAMTKELQTRVPEIVERATRLAQNAVKAQPFTLQQKDFAFTQRPFEVGVARGPVARGFSAVLVLGDMQGSASVADNIPDAAKKALTDMKDFLPYRNYRLLDSAWILGGGNSVTRLRGAEDQAYQLTLSPSSFMFGQKTTETIGLHVKLQDVDESASTSATAARDLEQSNRRLMEAETRLAAAKQRLADTHPEVRAAAADVAKADADYKQSQAEYAKADTDYKQSQADYDRKRAAATASRSSIVDTSFNMSMGETVVVGTSKLRGDKALILLLTAVPPSTTTPGSSKGSSSSTPNSK